MSVDILIFVTAVYKLEAWILAIVDRFSLFWGIKTQFIKHINQAV